LKHERERDREVRRKVEVRRKLWEEGRDTLYLEGEGASFCYKIPRLYPLVFLVRIE
jgi:hypothetical protein